MRKKKKKVQVKEHIQKNIIEKGNVKRKRRVEQEKIAAKVNESLAKTDAILV